MNFGQNQATAMPSPEFDPGTKLPGIGDDLFQRPPAGFRVAQLSQDSAGILIGRPRGFAALGIIKRWKLLEEAGLDGPLDPHAKVMAVCTRVMFGHRDSPKRRIVRGEITVRPARGWSAGRSLARLGVAPLLGPAAPYRPERASEGSIRSRRLDRRSLARALGVRRERCVSSRGCETHTWKEVVNQEAVEADREATNGREPSMSKGCSRQFSESAGHNAK